MKGVGKQYYEYTYDPEKDFIKTGKK